MKYEEWPLFIRKRHALTHILLVGEIGTGQLGEDKMSTTVSAETVLGWLYTILTTLDTKASALMRLNSVLIAAAAFLLGLFLRSGGTILSTAPDDARLIVVSALLSAVSIFLCLWIVNVSWAFLGRIKVLPVNAFDCTDELKHLDRACVFRYRVYRTGWSISLIASLLFLFEFLHQTAHVLFGIK